MRYAISPQKIQKNLGWELSFNFDEALNDTVNWYKQNKPWWDRVKSGQYQEYYQRWYSLS